MKLRTLALLTTLVSFCAQADVLTPAEALGRAAENLPAGVAPARRAAALRNARPLLTIGAAEPEVYVFGSVAGGLVVASAESETPVLLGYSEDYVEGSELPPSLKWMVEQYGREINALRTGNVVKRTLRRASQTDYDPVSPICETTWNQGAPYNYDCPLDGNTRTYTGCVATAMAQVLKTYEYPAKCSGGTFSYEWRNADKTLSKNFDSVTLDWANMLNSYSTNASSTSASSRAVATLMSAVGYASQMNYGTDGSGTHGLYCAEGMVRNFGYDYSLQYLYRDWFDLDDWIKKVYDEIAGGHPVYYDGANLEEKVGHAFVIDGYQGDGRFHVNWGWGGQLNGYFLLTALDPEGEQGIGGSSGGYSDDCGAIFNMRPEKTMTAAEAPLTLYSESPMQVPSTKKLGAAISDNIDISNFSPYTIPTLALALRFTDEAGNNYYSKLVGLPDDFGVGYSLSGTANFTIPSDLPEGKYIVSRVAYNPTSKELFDLYYDRGVASRISATVSGSTVTFSDYVEPIEEALYFAAESIPSVIYFGEEFSVYTEFYNTTQTAYTGYIYIDIYEKNTNKYMGGWSSNEFTLAPMKGIKFNPTLEINKGELAPGEYTLCFSCDDESVVSATQDVIVRARPSVIRGSNFECTSNRMSYIGFSVDLTALNSDFSGMVALAIAKTKNSPVLWSDKFNIDILEGQTVTKEYSDLDLSEKLTEGTKYIIYGVYVDENGKSANFEGETTVSFTATDEQVGIENVKTAAGNATYFDLTGRRVDNPAGGIYIRRQGSNTQTIQIR